LFVGKVISFWMQLLDFFGYVCVYVCVCVCVCVCVSVCHDGETKPDSTPSHF